MSVARCISTSALLILTFLFGQAYSSARTGDKARHKTPLRDVTEQDRCLQTLPSVHKLARVRASAVRHHQSRESSVQGQGETIPLRCKRQEQLDLSGTYSGVYYLKENEKEVAATLRIAGNSFELVSDSLNGRGVISAVNSCGETAISLRFLEASGEGAETRTSLMGSAISLDARTAGAMMSHGDIESFRSNRAVVLATARDRSGKLAGADIAFVICPRYPKCKRYPSCPCPDPR